MGCNNTSTDRKIRFNNGRVEQAVKLFVIGRKNWLFSDTNKGAYASGRCYRIIGSAVHNNLNFFGYLSYLLTELPNLGEDPTDEQLDDLMPWSESLPNYCSNIPSLTVKYQKRR